MSVVVVGSAVVSEISLAVVSRAEHKSLMRCLHDPANVQQMSSNSPAFWMHLLEVCWTFAGSCKHPITQTCVSVQSILLLTLRRHIRCRCCCLCWC